MKWSMSVNQKQAWLVPSLRLQKWSYQGSIRKEISRAIISTVVYLQYYYLTMFLTLFFQITPIWGHRLGKPRWGWWFQIILILNTYQTEKLDFNLSCSLSPSKLSLLLWPGPGWCTCSPRRLPLSDTCSAMAGAHLFWGRLASTGHPACRLGDLFDASHSVSSPGLQFSKWKAYQTWIFLSF